MYVCMNECTYTCRHACTLGHSVWFLYNPTNVTYTLIRIVTVTQFYAWSFVCVVRACECVWARARVYTNGVCVCVDTYLRVFSGACVCDCVFVCASVCVNVCAFVRMSEYVCERTQSCTCKCERGCECGYQIENTKSAVSACADMNLPNGFVPVYMWTHTHTRKHTQTHTFIHTYIHACWLTYTHIWISTDIQTYIQTYTKTYIIPTHTIHHKAVSHSFSVSPFYPLSPTLALKHSHTELFSHRFAYTRTLTITLTHTPYHPNTFYTHSRALIHLHTHANVHTRTLTHSHCAAQRKGSR